MRPKQIYIIGAGGHGKVAVRAAQLSGCEVKGVFDDDTTKHGTTICGVPVAGKLADILDAPRLPTLIAIGDNYRRLSIADELNLPWATIVHPAAVVDACAELTPGCLVLPGAVVQVGARVGHHAIINSSATIEHDCQIGRTAHVSCRACLGGGVSVGEAALIGLSATVLPGVRVGRSATIGAGAVVTRDVSPSATVVGVPARVLSMAA